MRYTFFFHYTFDSNDLSLDENSSTTASANSCLLCLVLHEYFHDYEFLFPHYISVVGMFPLPPAPITLKMLKWRVVCCIHRRIYTAIWGHICNCRWMDGRRRMLLEKYNVIFGKYKWKTSSVLYWNTRCRTWGPLGSRVRYMFGSPPGKQTVFQWYNYSFLWKTLRHIRNTHNNVNSLVFVINVSIFKLYSTN